MPPTPPDGAPVRPAVVVNAEIRALWQRAGGTLTVGERAEYERLVVEWAAAVRAGQARADAAQSTPLRFLF